jgi:hypothetical protein
MNGDRRRPGLALTPLAGLCTLLLQSPAAAAAAPAHAHAASAERVPEGVKLNAQVGTYAVGRAPKRSLDEVMKSIAQWQHQVMVDDSTADFAMEDGVLSMTCSDCGLAGPSSIKITDIDLGSVLAYEAGLWHIGISSRDGTQSFYGVLRGELGPGPHDAARIAEDRSVALRALVDLYDLAYLMQRASGVPVAGPSATRNVLVPEKPRAPSLEELAAGGDVETLQGLHGKAGPAQLAHALESAYGARARTQMLAGQLDAALATLGDGRKRFGKSARLRELETDYAVVADAYDLLSLAVRLDIAQTQPLLQQIRTLEPGDADAIEQMLAQALASRIAEQRAAGREQIAIELASAGQQLFSGQAGADAGAETGGAVPPPPPQ